MEVVDKIKHYEKIVMEIRRDYNDFDGFKEIVESNKEIPDQIDEICNLYTTKLNLWETKKE